MSEQTNLKLLELAAKGAGYEYKTLASGEIYIVRDGRWVPFNSLDDDGDAMRLAVAIAKTVGVFARLLTKEGFATIQDYKGLPVIEGSQSDIAKAARRVITRAAAAQPGRLEPHPPSRLCMCPDCAPSFDDNASPPAYPVSEPVGASDDVEDLFYSTVDITGMTTFDEALALKHFKQGYTSSRAAKQAQPVSEPALAAKIFQHLQGFATSTFGWHGNIPGDYERARAAHEQECVNRIAKELATQPVSEPAQQPLTHEQINDLMAVADAKDARPEAMEIRYETYGNCLWHTDCKVNSFKSGIMKVISHESESSTMKCLSCGQVGAYPKGRVGTVCVAVISTDAISDPETKKEPPLNARGKGGGSERT